jgi:hypothetical protein
MTIKKIMISHRTKLSFLSTRPGQDCPELPLLSSLRPAEPKEMMESSVRRSIVVVVCGFVDIIFLRDNRPVAESSFCTVYFRIQNSLPSQPSDALV